MRGGWRRSRGVDRGAGGIVEDKRFRGGVWVAIRCDSCEHSLGMLVTIKL
jgi:hypothetical protein